MQLRLLRCSNSSTLHCCLGSNSRERLLANSSRSNSKLRHRSRAHSLVQQQPGLEVQQEQQLWQLQRKLSWGVSEGRG
jgi:hypothetical protein